MLVEDILKNIDKDEGVFIDKLDKGIKLEVQTQNTLYKLEVTDPAERKIMIQGGSRFVEPKEVGLSGSTWGGSMLRVGWIGRDMCMEIWRGANTNPLTTSTVKGIKIIGSDWEYEFEWENSEM